MTRTRITDQTRTELATRYGAGETIPQLATTYGVSVDTIKRHLRKAGVTFRDDRTGTGPTNTTNRIAAAGTTPRAIRAWAQQTGTPCPGAGVPPARVIDAYLEAHTNPEGTP